MKTFEELGLSQGFVSVLQKAKITVPSEIQEKTIPLVLAGRDVIGGSATGSGKTLAFASSIVENLEKNGRVQALVLTPVRELAEQVATSIRKFSKHKELNILPVYGGTQMDSQIRLLQNTDVVVGTPGRILDHLGRGTLNLGKVKFLVLDEVDRMFDMGFQKDVEKILEYCPTKRQTMLFSATISSAIDHLAKKYTKKPVEVAVESHVDPSKLKQIYYDVPDGLKFSLFVHLLKKENSKLVMVFCGTRRNVDFVANNLNNLGIEAKPIHGGMVQNKRNRVLSEFNSKRGVNVLVCTDVAARGLDIKMVSHVYNYDLPKTSDDYIHRIGRTARAGKEGKAISVLCSRDYENFNNILKNDKIKIEAVPTPTVERVPIIIEDRPRRNGGSRGRNAYGKSGYGASRDRDSSRGRGGRDNRGSRGRESSRDRPRRDNDRRPPRRNSGGSRPPRRESSRSRPRRESSRDRPSRGGRKGNRSRGNFGRDNQRR